MEYNHQANYAFFLCFVSIFLFFKMFSLKFFSVFFFFSFTMMYLDVIFKSWGFLCSLNMWLIVFFTQGKTSTIILSLLITKAPFFLSFSSRTVIPCLLYLLILSSMFPTLSFTFKLFLLSIVHFGHLLIYLLTYLLILQLFLIHCYS